MTTLYYLSTIIFIALEWSWLISPIEKTNKAKKFLELSKQFKGKKYTEYSTEFKSELISRLWDVWVLIWLFIGLFTFQWVGYLLILLFNFIIIAPLSKLTRSSMAYTIINWLNSLLGLSFAIFVIINHYHLKINLTELFLSLIK